MQTVAFIDEKSVLLTGHINQYLMHKTDYKPLHNLVWDILQDWQSLDIIDEKMSGEKEQVFWFLVFELHYSDETILENDKELRRELYTGALYLERGQELPKNCIGLRPNKLVAEESLLDTEQGIVTSS